MDNLAEVAKADGDAAWLQGAAWLDALVSQARRALVR